MCSSHCQWMDAQNWHCCPWGGQSVLDHHKIPCLQKGIPCLRKGTSYSYSIPSLPIQGKICKWICARSPIFQTSNSRMEIEQSWKPLLLDDMVAWFLPICSKPQDQTKTTKVFQAYACFHVLLFPLIFFAHWMLWITKPLIWPTFNFSHHVTAWGKKLCTYDPAVERFEVPVCFPFCSHLGGCLERCNLSPLIWLMIWTWKTRLWVLYTGLWN